MANHVAESSPPKRVLTWIEWRSIFILVCIVGLVILFVQPVQKVGPQAVLPQDVIISSHAPVSGYVPRPIEPTTQPAPQVTEEAIPLPAAEPVESSGVLPVPLKAAPTRIQIPDANIDTTVSLHPLSDSERQARYLEPPNDPIAYWSDLFDQPGSNSTDLTYISGHGCEGLAICKEIDWPFSRLSDPNLVKEGTAVFVYTSNGEVCYRVDGPITTYPKTSLKNKAAVFGNAPLPERLVLVSCYTGAIHDRNVVSIASRVSCVS